MDKKALRAQVEEKIESALAGFAKGITGKKFKKHIKKAAKIVSDGLAMPAKKEAAIKKEPAAKKAANKKAAPAKKAKAATKKATAKKTKKAAATEAATV